VCYSRGVSHLALEKGAFFHSFKICKSSLHDLLREQPSSLFMLLLSVWSSISITFRSHGQDTGVLKLNVVTQVYVALSHS
jgi:hypothetical protein